MSINVGRYQAEGPYEDVNNLQDRSGVYIILTKSNVGDSRWTVVDIGESKGVRSRVENHDRADCWKRQNKGRLGVAVIYTPNQQQSGRMAIEQELRAQFNPVCGDK